MNVLSASLALNIAILYHLGALDLMDKGHVVEGGLEDVRTVEHFCKVFVYWT